MEIHRNEALLPFAELNQFFELCYPLVVFRLKNSPGKLFYRCVQCQALHLRIIKSRKERVNNIVSFMRKWSL